MVPSTIGSTTNTTRVSSHHRRKGLWFNLGFHTTLDPINTVSTDIYSISSRLWLDFTLMTLGQGGLIIELVILLTNFVH